ncbi:hypothetical protein GBAR_LOCUS4 [Geodia barretti]|uniref:Uncharacterized protein n=1 Tax=Geodia barretti TaxID=519541 RepID=A0AA35VX10_GEOBA|nr:hypothetical protein GBAR_LOCUS4 [Geodia barretti]
MSTVMRFISSKVRTIFLSWENIFSKILIFSFTLSITSFPVVFFYNGCVT